MNKKMAIMLVGLLGFLGCSDDDGTNTVGKANPVKPFGIIGTSTPTYVWTSLTGATHYRLLVQDKDETVIIDELFTVEETQCQSNETLCSIKTDVEVMGEHKWKIQTSTNADQGLWSVELPFNHTDFNGERYTDNADGTVTDHLTDIIWAKTAAKCNSAPFDIWCNYQEAVDICKGATIGGRTGWSLPPIAALVSVTFDPAVGKVCIGVQPPFDIPFSECFDFWSSSDSDPFECTVKQGISQYRPPGPACAVTDMFANEGPQKTCAPWRACAWCVIMPSTTE